MKKFKGRAKSRHESFNRLVKNYASIEDCYRHGREKHQWCFDAVVTICQYGIEDTNPDSTLALFDV